MQRAAQRRKAAAAAAQKAPVRRPRKKDRIPNQASHNEAPVHGKRGRYEFEVSMTERPSRKSTRKSMNRQKTDNAMRIKAMSRNAEPRTRASRPSRNPM